MRLTYGYDTSAKRWFPIHATTRREGIITDQPYLIAVESLQGGFSVGGRMVWTPFTKRQHELRWSSSDDHSPRTHRWSCGPFGT
jgi:hypothetical protein